jgi:hypothetical protein
MLRGSRDFDSIDEYKTFIREIFVRQNKRVAKEFAEEVAALRPLPERRTANYVEERVRVTTSSTIVVKSIVYSVPSRLIGSMIKVHIYDDRLECYVGGDFVVKLPRLRKGKERRHLVDYRHVVGSLIHKPQAFRHYIYKDDMFPTFAFRQAWERLDSALNDREACREFVKILRDAARPGGEKLVNDYLEGCLVRNETPSSSAVRALFAKVDVQIPSLCRKQGELTDYNVLLGSLREANA